MFTVEMLPALHGDCLWIEYGDAAAPRRVLIDAGPATSYTHLQQRLKQRLGGLPRSKRRFEALVVTHIDEDHVGGVLSLLLDPAHGARFGDVWFNGWRHLPEAGARKTSSGGSSVRDGGAEEDVLGPVDGEQLTGLIVHHELPWNEAFGGEALVVPDEGPLPSVTLRGGLRMTVVSPGTTRLKKLRTQWDRVVKKEGLVAGSPEEALERLLEERGLAELPDLLAGEIPDPEALLERPFKGDTSAANGSSIGLLAEYEGKRCLLSGDAFASELEAGLRRLLDERGESVLELDAFKLPHHGSRGNVRRELLELVRCRRFLFSSNGDKYHHPDAEAVARVIVHGRPGTRRTQLTFNYKTPLNEAWADSDLQEEFGYAARYPKTANGGTRVSL